LENHEKIIYTDIYMLIKTFYLIAI